MAQTLIQKLRIKEQLEICVINPPFDYFDTLGALPEGVTFSETPGKKTNYVHLFVDSVKTLEHWYPLVAQKIPQEALLWIFFPKGTGKIKSDLTRDKGWKCLSQHPMKDLTLISFNDDWSGTLYKNIITVPAVSQAHIDYKTNMAKVVDVKNRVILIPDDLLAAFDKSKKARIFFDGLSFTNRKEYVMWIIGAKRAETRTDRVAKAIQKLKDGKLNPAAK